VPDAYTAYAARADYRHNATYLASKALCDWTLIEGVIGGSVLNVGCAEPIDEIQWIDKVASWTSIDRNPAIIQMAAGVFNMNVAERYHSQIKFFVADS
jgi:hypothetical protein